MTETNYDFSWLEEGMLKRDANYSNVVCFEFKDPFRMAQMKAYFMTRGSDSVPPEIYYLGRWTGLCKLDSNGQSRPVTRDAGGGYDHGIENSITETRDALRYMDPILKERKTIFIIHDMEASREEERDKDLVDAIRAWSYNTDITILESTVILACSNVSLVLDHTTAERIAIVTVPLSKPGERAKMIIEQARKLLNGNMDRVALNILVQTSAGLDLHQLKTLLLENYHRSGIFSPEIIKELKSELIKRSELLEIEERVSDGFVSIGGYDVVKTFIRDTIIRTLAEPERAKRFNVTAPRGIIFFGPPGTGKTLFARALAREIHLPFINFRVESLFSQFLGVSGHRFRDAINRIEEASPAIVFIDEIDRLGKRRGDVNDGASEETRRVFNQVLEWLGRKERKSIIIGTTNRPSDLDRAFRVGRIDYWIPFLYPNAQARAQILRIYLSAAAVNEAAISRLAEQTDGYSGAELEELVRRANRLSFVSGDDSLTADHLVRSFLSYRIDREARAEEKQTYLAMAEEFTNDLEFLEELRNER